MIANARAQERQLLEDAARAPADATERVLGELWASGMDEIATQQPLGKIGSTMQHTDVPMPRVQDAQAQPLKQRFFESYAKVWARNATADALTAEVGTSIQAPAKYRVNGSLANLPAFGKIYSCKLGQPMQLAAPVAIWR